MELIGQLATGLSALLVIISGLLFFSNHRDAAIWTAWGAAVCAVTIFFAWFQGDQWKKDAEKKKAEAPVAEWAQLSDDKAREVHTLLAKSPRLSIFVEHVPSDHYGLRLARQLSKVFRDAGHQGEIGKLGDTPLPESGMVVHIHEPRNAILLKALSIIAQELGEPLVITNSLRGNDVAIQLGLKSSLAK